MNYRFSFKQMKTSAPLVEYAERKLKPKASKIGAGATELNIHFSIEGDNHIARCVVRSRSLTIDVEAKSTDMYASLDLVADKLEMRIRKHKEKFKQFDHNNSIRRLPIKKYGSKDDCDSIPIDASDLIKYENARLRARAS